MGIKIKNFKTTYRKVADKALKKTLSKKRLERIGDDIVKNIQNRTKKGLSIDDNRKISKFTPLTTDYKKLRAKNRNSLYKTTSPSKSNITFTGDMVFKKIEVFVKGLSFRIGMKDEKSSKKARYVEKERPFMNMSNKEISDILKEIRLSVAKIMRKAFK